MHQTSKRLKIEKGGEQQALWFKVELSFHEVFLLFCLPPAGSWTYLSGVIVKCSVTFLVELELSFPCTV